VCASSQRPLAYALQEIPRDFAKRLRWLARARSTLVLTVGDESPLLAPLSARNATAPTITCMSIRSASGPEIRAA